MPLKLDYFYGGEAEQYSFYRIPKVLFTDQNYSTMTMEARVLYGLLLDRMGLSARNGWLDSCGRVFIYFTLEDAMAQMGFGHNKAVRHFKELEDIGLIERKKQGQGKPTRIYVKNFILPPEPGHSPSSPEAPPQTSQKRKSALPSATQVVGQTSQIGKSALPGAGSQDFPKTNANNTEINKTEMNDTELSIPPSAPAPPVRQPVGQTRQADRIDRMDAYREIIRENIDYDILLQERPHDAEQIDGYVELMLEVCCSTRDFIRISKEELPTGVVKARFLKLTREHIEYVMDCVSRNTTQIGNIKAYLLAALYNAPVTIGQYYTALVSHDMAQGFDGG